MLPVQEFQCLAILNAALEATYGIVVKTTNPTKAQQRIYKFRLDLGDPTYKDIMIRTSPENSETQIWLIKPMQVTVST